MRSDWGVSGEAVRVGGRAPWPQRAFGPPPGGFLRLESTLYSTAVSDVSRDPLTPLAFFERTVRVFPNKTAVVYGDRRWTWAAFAEEVGRFAGALARAGGEAGVMERVEQVKDATLGNGTDAVGPLEIEQRRALAAKQCSMEAGGHEPAARGPRPATRTTTVIGHHDVTGQVLVEIAQPVAQPTAQARTANDDAARVHLQDPGTVRGGLGVHRVDHAEDRKSVV